MNCVRCGTELIWGNDFSYDDYGCDGEGIISNYSCPECEVYVEVYQPESDG